MRFIPAPGRLAAQFLAASATLLLAGAPALAQQQEWFVPNQGQQRPQGQPAPQRPAQPQRQAAPGQPPRPLPPGQQPPTAVIGIVDVGSLSQSESSQPGARVADDASPRVGAGVGISWRSPFGLINIDLAQAVVKDRYDETQVFRFGFGTRF